MSAAQKEEEEPQSIPGVEVYRERLWERRQGLASSQTTSPQVTVARMRELQLRGRPKDVPPPPQVVTVFMTCHGCGSGIRRVDHRGLEESPEPTPHACAAQLGTKWAGVPAPLLQASASSSVTQGVAILPLVYGRGQQKQRFLQTQRGRLAGPASVPALCSMVTLSPVLSEKPLAVTSALGLTHPGPRC